MSKKRLRFEIVTYFTYLLTYLLTPWSRFLLEKLTGFKIVKELPTFLEPVSSLSHLQEPTTRPYP